MDTEKHGCFAWIVRFKQSCNERWARFRNRLRRTFYARRGQRIDPSSIVNETGTKDLIITKSPCKTSKVLPESLCAPAIIQEELAADVGSGPASGNNDSFDELVGDFVSGIITTAAEALRIEKQTTLGNKNVVVENSADNVSLSPSIISQIADTEVKESLSNVLLETNLNQSAIDKTIKEFMVQASLELLAEKLMTDNLLLDYNC